MKLQAVGVLGILVAAAFSVGCNGSSQAGTSRAKAPTDVIGAMNAELENAISTTSLTSDQMPLPESRMPVAKWEDDEAPAKPLQTWGVEEAPPHVEDLSQTAFDRL